MGSCTIVANQTRTSHKLKLTMLAACACMVSNTASPTCAAYWYNLMPTANVGNTLLIHLVYTNWKCHRSLSVSVQHTTRMQGNTANFAHAMLARTCKMWIGAAAHAAFFSTTFYTTRGLAPCCNHCLGLKIPCFFNKNQLINIFFRCAH